MTGLGSGNRRIGLRLPYRSHFVTSGPGMHLALALAHVVHALGPLLGFG